MEPEPSATGHQTAIARLEDSGTVNDRPVEKTGPVTDKHRFPSHEN